MQMKGMFCLSLVLTAGSIAQTPKEPAPSIGFPQILPISDADPSDRHPISVKVPSELKVSKDGKFLTVTPSGFEQVELTVGKKMETGILIETRMHHGTETRVLSLLTESTLTWEGLTKGKRFVPKNIPNEASFIECIVTLFETDIPAQHLWHPKGGKAYKELWTHTFLEAIK